jgi:hypothetical protein
LATERGHNLVPGATLLELLIDSRPLGMRDARQVLPAGDRGQRRAPGSAWTTRKGTSQRPTPARFHLRCHRPSRADARSHRRPGKAPGCDPGDSSLSRIAQARLLVLPTPVAEARAYAERGPAPRAWCF